MASQNLTPSTLKVQIDNNLANNGLRLTKEAGETIDVELSSGFEKRSTLSTESNLNSSKISNEVDSFCSLLIGEYRRDKSKTDGVISNKIVKQVVGKRKNFYKNSQNEEKKWFFWPFF